MNDNRIFKNIAFLFIVSIIVFFINNKAFWHFGYIVVSSFSVYAFCWVHLPERLVEKGELQFQLRQIYSKEKIEDLDSSDLEKKEKIIEKIDVIDSKVDGYLIMGMIIWIINLAIAILTQ